MAAHLRAMVAERYDRIGVNCDQPSTPGSGDGTSVPVTHTRTLSVTGSVPRDAATTANAAAT